MSFFLRKRPYENDKIVVCASRVLKNLGIFGNFNSYEIEVIEPYEFNQMRHPRIELGSQPWEGCIIPVDQWRLYYNNINK